MKKNTNNFTRGKVLSLVVLVLIILFALTAAVVLQKYQSGGYLRTSVGTSGAGVTGDWEGLEKPDVGPNTIVETENCTDIPMPGSCPPSPTTTATATLPPGPGTTDTPGAEPTDTGYPYYGYPYSGKERDEKVAGDTTDDSYCPQTTAICIKELEGPQMNSYQFDIESDPTSDSVLITETSADQILQRICNGSPTIPGCTTAGAAGCATMRYEFGKPTISLVGVIGKFVSDTLVEWGLIEGGAYIKSTTAPFEEFWANNVYPNPAPGSEIIDLLEWRNTYKLTSENIKNLNKWHPMLGGVAGRQLDYIRGHEDRHLDIWRTHENNYLQIINFSEPVDGARYTLETAAVSNVPLEIKDAFNERWLDEMAEELDEHNEFDVGETHEVTGKRSVPVDGISGVECNRMEGERIKVTISAGANGSVRMKDNSVKDSVASWQTNYRYFLRGSEVIIEAIPDASFEFDKWESDGEMCECVGQGAECTIESIQITNNCKAIFKAVGSGGPSGSPSSSGGY